MKEDSAQSSRLGIGVITWCGLLAVAAAAAVLSFASLRNLAIVCGTPAGMAWLLPVAIDAAAVVATRVWLAPATFEQRGEARRIAVAALALSVAGNATDHALAAYDTVPPWWAVVAVAAVPPVVLGTVAHLVANLARGRGEPRAARPSTTPTVTIEPAAHSESPADLVEIHQPGEDLAAQAARTIERLKSEGVEWVGRTTLAREMGISQHQARELLNQHRRSRRQAFQPAGDQT